MTILDKWDKSVPIEVSSYVEVDNIEVLNESNFKLDTNKPVMIDLFSGAGGFSVGCGWVGFQSVLANDYFEPALKTWLHNHPNSLGILGDIRQIDENFIDNLLKKHGVRDIDLITGGVPCQGFSRANRKHDDEDVRNYLFLDYMRMVGKLNPKCIILENVSGMKTTANGKYVDEILSSMRELGYNSDVKLLNAADFGVPQVRQRLIFVGIRSDLNVSKFEYPKPQYISEKDNNSLISNDMEIYRTVKDAISDLPALESHEKSDEYVINPENEYQKLMRGLDNRLENRPCYILSNHVAPKHDAATIERIKNTEPGKPMYDRFKQRIRLSYSNPSPTQLAGGIRPQFQFGHPTQNRGLTIRERARIQSFPDSYVFCGGTVQERVQTGNAVPPLLVYNIAKELIKIIG
ncbi:DNA cytosine methyltransferase [Clostridium sp.]|uniref:DNA cytosine methyltransferase n=1 Tax=Clostridium sp. TaxID=1506 RepID=UPI00305A5019